jgi:hypothetical protein
MEGFLMRTTLRATAMLLLIFCGQGFSNPHTPPTPSTNLFWSDFPADIFELPECAPQFNRLLGAVQQIRRGTRIDTIECEIPQPELKITPGNLVGDKFTPVEFDVSYTLRGKDRNFSVSSTMGVVEVNQGKVTILGDGRLGDGIVNIQGEEFVFTMISEPVCRVQDKVDCNGLRVTRNSQYIYYGEDDTKIVKWELFWIEHISTRHWEEQNLEDQYPYGMPLTAEKLNEIKDKIYQMNNILKKSGVYVELVLAEAIYYPYENLDNLSNLRTSKGFGRRNADFLMGYGMSRQGTCGVARVNLSYIPSWPPVSVSRCGILTILHELGHNAALAHGPNNQSNSRSGYLYPDMGHGMNDSCGYYDDIMSYGDHGVHFTNSKLSCEEVIPGSSSAMSGDRGISDTAYVLNMLRYTIALIHDENLYSGVVSDLPLSPAFFEYSKLIVD